jgi:hypothetical protein
MAICRGDTLAVPLPDSLNLRNMKQAQRGVATECRPYKSAPSRRATVYSRVLAVDTYSIHMQQFLKPTRQAEKFREENYRTNV